MAVTQRLRFEIFRRDGHRCRYCGATPAEHELEVDHVVPTALGGSDDPSNLVTSCSGCNRGKTSSAPDAVHVTDVNAKAARWAEAMEAAATISRQRAAEMDKVVAAFDEEWARYTYVGTDDPIQRQDDWARSIETFLNAGLNLDDLIRFVVKAMPSPWTWKYFCKLCWTEIRLRQSMAAEALAAETEET
jgi:ABC-type nitrate/sulfonate/bicarbonate transport system substrate-binding protein